ncbi:MAG: hypothetical protein HY260_00095 [Chloroflexi bacterium]|nr:hypothetical protein [Chloroflexota bacterium]
MTIGLAETVNEEEWLVAELELLGIRYLSRQTAYQASAMRDPASLLADLVRQPSARVRAAVIAVLLAHPEYAEAAPLALERLRPFEQLTMKLFYTAAALLQRHHVDRLRRFAGDRWHWLPDLFSEELGVPPGESPRERLKALGRAHSRLTHTTVNWGGTYENVVERLLRRWELERQWSR